MASLGYRLLPFLLLFGGGAALGSVAVDHQEDLARTLERQAREAVDEAAQRVALPSLREVDSLGVREGNRIRDLRVTVRVGAGEAVDLDGSQVLLRKGADERTLPLWGGSVEVQAVIDRDGSVGVGRMNSTDAARFTIPLEGDLTLAPRESLFAAFVTPGGKPLRLDLEAPPFFEGTYVELDVSERSS